MNILTKIRSFFVGETEIQDSPVELLSKAIQERDQFAQQMLREEQLFVGAVDDLTLKIEACNKAIEKGQYVDEYAENLNHLKTRLENTTTNYINTLADNAIKKGDLDSKIVDLEKDLLEKAVELTAFLSEEEQLFVKATLEVWAETGQIKGEDVTNQVEAIHKALELITVSDVIEKAYSSIAIKGSNGYNDRIVRYDSPVEGHYANVIVKDKDGKILFLKRAADKTIAPNQYCLPGGHIDAGETIEQAAARELKEESGLECDPSCLYVKGKAKCDDGKWAFYLGGHPTGTVMLLDGESSNACWMSQEEWLNADLIFDLKDHLVALESVTVFLEDIPTLEKGEQEELVKGGPPAMVGERRIMGGKEYIKMHDGPNPWRPYNPQKHAHLAKHTGGNGGRIQHQEVVAAQQVANQTMPHSVSEKDIDDFEETMERPSVEERWGAYDTFLRMVVDKVAKGLVAFGTGGVGKTFTLETVLKEKGLRGFDEEKHDLNKEEDYDYVKITGKASPSAVYQALFEYQDKLVIFDDCDSALKQQDAVNFFKGALDSSGDGTISYKAATPIKTDRIKGAKESASGENMFVPNRFKFKGGVIFISNLSPEEMPQPLVDSRCLAIDLSMTKDETLDRMQTILPKLKVTDAQGEDLGLSKEEKQQALDFLKKHAGKIRPGKINARTLLNIAKVIHSSPKNWESVATTLLAN